jgi:tRNA dimethylallyltransferase
VTGRPLSVQLRASPGATGAALWLILALLPAERAWLHERIAARFHAMLERGLVEELAGLRQRFALEPAMPSMRTVGYRQAWQFLENRISGDELRERGVYATRQLAKRQLTWLRGTGGLTAIDALDPRAPERVIDAAAAYLSSHAPGT